MIDACAIGAAETWPLLLSQTRTTCDGNLQRDQRDDPDPARIQHRGRAAAACSTTRPGPQRRMNVGSDAWRSADWVRTDVTLLEASMNL